jgi:hypothetical protein
MKMMKVVIAVALALCLAAPAFAEMKLNGYYRLQGTYYDTGAAANAENQDFSQRLRLKLTNQLNENVSFVYYAEMDTDWGQAGKGGIGGGGKLGGDGVLVETKNVYLTVKNDKMITSLGLQGMADMFDGILLDDDAAGAKFFFDFGAADLTLMYSKFDEGDKNIDDDTNMYAGTVSFAATEMLTLGAGAYYVEIQDDVAGDEDVLWYGLRADAKLSDAFSLSAWGFMQDFSSDQAGVADGDTYLLKAAANYKFGMGDVTAQILYAPEETNASDQLAEISDFYFDKNLIFMFADLYATNNGAGEDKFKIAGQGGYGLTCFALTGNLNFENDIYAGFGFAYADTDSDDLGTEFGARVGKKFFGNVDLSVRAAQWSAGDLLINGVKGEDETKVIGMVNVGF